MQIIRTSIKLPAYAQLCVDHSIFENNKPDHKVHHIMLNLYKNLDGEINHLNYGKCAVLDSNSILSSWKFCSNFICGVIDLTVQYIEKYF